MNKLTAIAIIALTVLAWIVGDRLSDDAVSMVIGFVLGTLASIPSALLVVAAGRRKEQPDRAYQVHNSQSYPPMPPVVMFAGHNQQALHAPSSQPLLPPTQNTHPKVEIENADW